MGLSLRRDHRSQRPLSFLRRTMASYKEEAADGSHRATGAGRDRRSCGWLHGSKKRASCGASCGRTIDVELLQYRDSYFAFAFDCDLTIGFEIKLLVALTGQENWAGFTPAHSKVQQRAEVTVSGSRSARILPFLIT